MKEKAIEYFSKISGPNEQDRGVLSELTQNLIDYIQGQRADNEVAEERTTTSNRVSD